MIRSVYPADTAFSTPVENQYDVVVIGAGPAGTTVSALLAERGYSVVVLERSTIPRFHIGESLIPETYWPLKRLGLIEKMKASAFPKKFSVQFISDGWKESAPFFFDEHCPLDSSQTWQVERADFDKMLAENAVEKGATVRTQAQVLEVLFDGDRATGVKVKLTDDDGNVESREIQSKIVVDCSGNSAFLSNRLKLRVADPYLQKGAIWTYFKGARRGEGKNENATLVMQTKGQKTWFWFIPLRNDIVSIGCTGEMSHMFPKGSTPEETYHRELKLCPALENRLENAEQCMEFFMTKDFSYSSTQAAGDGWVLCGDAFGFLDPVYSSGVYLAMKGGEFVADAAHNALSTGDISAQTLGAWQDEYRFGVSNFRKLVYAFYTPGFSFGSFLREHPQFKSNLVDILIGAVFKPEHSKMFEAMGEVVPERVK